MNRPKHSIFTHSLGSCDHHDLPSKLRAAASAGFASVEIYQLDLDHHAASSYYTSYFPGDDAEAVAKRELVAAKHIGELCTEIGLKVLCLQPLRDIPGLVDPTERQKTWDYALSRFDVMDALGTDLVLCCSSTRPLPELSTDFDLYAEELGSFADAALHHPGGPKRVALEGLSWGTVFDTVEQAWEIVRRADRDNLGVCLDSFNALGREWADPTSPTGTLPDPSSRLDSLLATLCTIPLPKIFLLQIADARLLPQPLAPSPSPSEPRPSRMIWSRSSRLFPFELDRGAYLPVLDFADVVVNALGYKGEWSLEVFNDSLSVADARVPREHALRGIKGLKALEKALGEREASRGHDSDTTAVGTESPDKTSPTSEGSKDWLESHHVEEVVIGRAAL